MLEPNVYSISLILTILLMLEFNRNNDQLEDLFRIKSWKEIDPNISNIIIPKYEDSSVSDAYNRLLNYSSEEMFSSDTLRPVNYFLGWFQTILWMFSRTAKSLKPFVKAKLVRTSIPLFSLKNDFFLSRSHNYPNINHYNFPLKKFLVY
jgi:hypothetical protein